MISMRRFILILTIFAAEAAFAASPNVRDGATIDLGEVTFRLDGIDVPAFDQTCLDDYAEGWACGVEARDRLAGLINGRDVHCEDVGTDRTYPKWRLGICTAEGETTSLNQLLVRSGFAVNVAADGVNRFAADETEAKQGGRGLWKGCFAAPQDFRAWRKDGTLLGASCRGDKDREIREALFPVEPAMPSGCGIKGKYALRAHVTGNIGIYHLQVCRSYPALTHPDRWFCSEDDAKASGFRKAYNCRPVVRKPG